MITTTCAWSRTTCRRSCGRRGFAASRRCPTHLRMKPISTSSPTEAGVDPIEYRLRYLKDQRAIDLVNAVAERAGWKPRPVRQEKGRRHRARARLCLCALRPQQVSRLRRGVVGLDRRRCRQQGDRRCQRDARGRGAGFRPDDQSGRRAAPDPRQCHPVHQPRADGGNSVRAHHCGGARMGRLPHHHFP